MACLGFYANVLSMNPPPSLEKLVPCPLQHFQIPCSTAARTKSYGFHGDWGNDFILGLGLCLLPDGDLGSALGFCFSFAGYNSEFAEVLVAVGLTVS